MKHRQRWDCRVAELKAQIWAGADPVEEATDMAAATAAAAALESDTEQTEEEQAQHKLEKQQAAEKEQALWMEPDKLGRRLLFIGL